MNPQDIESEFIKNVYDSRDRRFLCSELQKIWPEFQQEFGLETGLQLEISCVWRSAKAQNDLYQWGRTKGKRGRIRTNCDGVISLSDHQFFPSKAIDVYVSISKKAIWDTEYYDQLGPLAHKYNLDWGGDWHSFKDKPHLGLKT